MIRGAPTREPNSPWLSLPGLRLGVAQRNRLVVRVERQRDRDRAPRGQASGASERPARTRARGRARSLRPTATARHSSLASRSRPSGEDSDGFNFDQQAFDDEAGDQRRAGRRILRKVAAVHLVHARIVGDIAQVHRGLDDIGQGASPAAVTAVCRFSRVTSVCLRMSPGPTIGHPRRRWRCPPETPGCPGGWPTNTARSRREPGGLKHCLGITSAPSFSSDGADQCPVSHLSMAAMFGWTSVSVSATVASRRASSRRPPRW